MRVISGKYRGKKLKEFDFDTTKPTLDRVKESMFNLIQFDILGAKVLDLFCGTGALGIEAISRGASFACFVDKNDNAIKLTKENLKGIDGNFCVLQQDSIEFLDNTQEKFDIILLDPPFSSDLGIRAIMKIVEKNILSDNGTIIFETLEANSFNFDEKTFKITHKKYGTVAVYKLEKV
ncbi:MAG: 16S rRNA (guanine(966)-N(2))-methyltransferase RsmD [Candidatus Onthoplasma sp.]